MEVEELEDNAENNPVDSQIVFRKVPSICAALDSVSSCCLP